MTWSLDARIPIVTVADPTALAVALAAGTPAAVLAAAPHPELPGAIASASFEPSGPAHPAACACCAGRSAAAAALDRLFQARVRGQCGWFERVLALAGTDAARADIAAALREDAVTAARFRAAT